jgi:RHS repeat-associated protein
VKAEPDGTPIALDLGAVVVDLTAGGGNDRFRHLDFRGNVKWVSDMSGTVVAHIGYGPHGVLETHGAADGEPTFAQGLPAGELLRLGHRLYDPEARRFLAPDPVFQVVNAYSYTLGDPVHFWDPSGRQGVSALDVARGVAYVGAITGAVAVASAVSIGASPVVVGYAVVAALGSTGVAVGLVVPFSGPLAASAAAVAAVVRLPAGSAFAGFAAGQALQQVLAEPVDVARVQPKPPVVIGSPEAQQQGGSEVGKSLEFRFANPGGGCSPTAIAGTAPVVPRKLLLAAAAVQLVAALLVVRRSKGGS